VKTTGRTSEMRQPAVRVVAQSGNLPDRRFAIGRAFEISNWAGFATAEQNDILRYCRLPICATRLTSIFFLLLFGLSAGLQAQTAADEERRVRFCAVDIFVDSGSTPLAAYQLRFAVTNGAAKIVGIEGGEHAAFHQPPYYDPKAIQNEIAIIASFSTAADLPKGKTRVATIHLQTSGDSLPRMEVKLQATADAQGKKFPCLASFEERKTK
jgi:hypothetical protein